MKPSERIIKTFTGWKNVFDFTFMLFQTDDQKKKQLAETYLLVLNRGTQPERLSKYQRWLSSSHGSSVLKLHGASAVLRIGDHTERN